MRTIQLGCLISFFVAVTLVPAAAEESAFPRTFLMSSGYRPSWAPWESGSLEYSMLNYLQARVSFSVHFSGVTQEGIETLLISRDNLQFDASGYVRHLRSSFPSRIGMNTGDGETRGDLATVVVSIPYLDQGPESTDCRSLFLFVRGGQLVRTYTMAESSERCSH